MNLRKAYAPEIDELLAGLWGSKADIDATLQTLPRKLAEDPLVFGYDHAVIEALGEIALTRRDLPADDRLALVTGALAVACHWAEMPMSSSAATYPFLDAVALDETLPATLRSDALNRLEAEARQCLAQLARGEGEPPPWGYGDDPEDAVANQVWAAHGHMLTTLHTIHLVDLPSLQPWRSRLIRAVNLGVHEVILACANRDPAGPLLQAEVLFDAVLPLPWLDADNRAQAQQLFDAFWTEALATVRARWAVMSDDEVSWYRVVPSYDNVPEAARREIRELLRRRWELDEGAA